MHRTPRAENFLIGPKAVLDALLNNKANILSIIIQENTKHHIIREIISLSSEFSIPYRFANTQYINRLVSENHQGVVAKITQVPLISLEDLIEKTYAAPLPLLVVLDMIQDVGNFGTLARTLYALGAGGVIFPRHNSVTPTTAAIKASAGALCRIPLTLVSNVARTLQTLKEHAFHIYGTACKSESCNIFTTELVLPAVLVLGNEEKGVRPLVLKNCDTVLHIPMQYGFDSINIAQCGALCAGLFARLTYV